MNNIADILLGLDDLAWTHYWLGNGRRCDLLRVSLYDDSSQPLVRIVAIESKARGNNASYEPLQEAEPFKEGLSQVESTLDVLARLLEPKGESGSGDAEARLPDELRLAAFVEQLASRVFADMLPLRSDDERKDMIRDRINALSRRELAIDGKQLALEGLVVCTQFGVAGDRREQHVWCRAANRKWPVRLVWLGADAVNHFLLTSGWSSSSADVPRDAGVVEGIGATAVSPEDDSGPTHFLAGAAVEQAHETGRVQAQSSDVGRTIDLREGAGEGAAASEVQRKGLEEEGVARALYASLKHRGFRVREPDVSKVSVGPTLVAVPIHLERGESIDAIRRVTKDLAREVGASSVSVENDPDLLSHVRFTVARRHRVFPPLPQTPPPLVDAQRGVYLGLHLGQTVVGTDYVSYVSGWPHLLIAGTTGSGKTTLIRSLLRQLASTAPEYLRIVVVDGKGEFDYVDLIPKELFVSEFPEVVTDVAEAPSVLGWLVNSEIPRRKQVYSDLLKQGLADDRSALAHFVRMVERHERPAFPALLVVIDEFAEVMRGPKAEEFEMHVQSIAQRGRSMLIHLVLATQRPDATVVKGTIKANLPSRIALRLPSHHDSMTILDSPGAEELLGQGDFLFKTGGSLIRLQGYSA